MHRAPSTPLAAGLLAAGFLVFAPPAEAAPKKAWNQEEVTATAVELKKAVDELWRYVQLQRMTTTPGPGRRAYFTFRNNLELIRFSSASLSDALASGQGLDETFPIYERMGPFVRDILINVPAGLVPATAKPKIRAVRDQLVVLADFYGVDLRENLPRLVEG